MGTYNFDRKVQSGKFEIGVDTTAAYGYFEHDELGDECSGGLWFEREGGKLVLTDYDGVAVLSKFVIKGLRDIGCRVPRDFE